jgi:hypothetical protein
MIVIYVFETPLDLISILLREGELASQIKAYFVYAFVSLQFYGASVTKHILKERFL